MIVRITTHGRTKGVVLAHTPPDLAHAMGLFQPARWSPKANAYLLGEEHLDAFRRHLARHDAQLVDERQGEDTREKFTGPLPECSACGQPASHQAALSLNRCPACGAAWRPVVADTPAATGSWTPPQQCPACGRRQREGWAFCGGCGAAMAAPPAPGPRPAHVERPKLAEPALFGDLAGEVVEELDPTLDHMQRAAGDR